MAEIWYVGIKDTEFNEKEQKNFYNYINALRIKEFIRLARLPENKKYTLLSLAAGCFIYCRRDAFEDVGGFSEEVYASEEIWLSRAITSWGRDREMSFDIITDWPISTSVRKVDWYSQGKLLVLFLPIMLFPPLVRVQSFCKAWYRRPNT